MASKSREFNDILNECLEQLLVQGGSIEQCLSSHPGYTDELQPLLETALATKKAAAIRPRPEFRDRARYEFSRLLRDTEQEKSRSSFGWRWRPGLVAVLAVFLLLVVAGSGTVLVASGSMPDQPLYSVKLFTERVQLMLTFSTVGKAEVYAGLADKRVMEIVRLAGESKVGYIASTTQLLDDYLAEIAVLSASYDMADVSLGASAASEWAFEGEAGVAESVVEEEAIVVDQAEAGEEEAIAADGSMTAETALALSAPAKSISQNADADDQASIWMAVVSYNYPARLRAALNTAPPSVRPALMRALTISQASYELALQYQGQPSE